MRHRVPSGSERALTLNGLFRVKLKTAWLPTPFASFPFTSPPVRRRVPPNSVSTLPSPHSVTAMFKLGCEVAFENNTVYTGIIEISLNG